MPRKPKLPLSPAERLRSVNRTKQATRAAKLRAEGRVPRQVWAAPAHWPAILELVERLHRG